MEGFIIRTKDNQVIRARFYLDLAPKTAAAFLLSLPFTRLFVHARVSGQEFWIDNAPSLDVIQENASVFVEPGEIVIGPKGPLRNKVCNCMGVFYGEGKGLDCSNIFAKVYEEDMVVLQQLGEAIWRNGAQELSFEQLP